MLCTYQNKRTKLCCMNKTTINSNLCYEHYLQKLKNDHKKSISHIIQGTIIE